MSAIDSPTILDKNQSIKHFHDVIEEMLDPLSAVEQFRQLFECLRNKEQYLAKLEGEVSDTREKVEEVRVRKDALYSKMYKTSASLEELDVKRRDMREVAEEDWVTQEELSDMLERALNREQEKEKNTEKLKKDKKYLVAMMSYFKSYLDVYIDEMGKEHLRVYFKTFQKGKTKEPQVWVEILTQDFHAYQMVDSSLSQAEPETHMRLMKMFEEGSPLRLFLIEARRLCLAASVAPRRI